MEKPVVSVIVPTKNSSAFLEACLQSIHEQTYPNIELIIVDNFSTDATQKIAKKYTDKVFEKGPERSAQRNEGAARVRGEYLFFVDCDMELTRPVVEQCVLQAQKEGVVGVIIPEESFGEGFWAQCKRLEKSYYVGVDWMEAARFFPKKLFDEIGGYDEELISGEDWDLSDRTALKGKIARVDAFIQHNEGGTGLREFVKKKRYYAKHFSKSAGRSQNLDASKKRTSVLSRYGLFLSNPMKIIQYPLQWMGMVCMKTCEFGFGFLGYNKAKL